MIGGTSGRPSGVPPLDQWQDASHLRWSMQNIARFLPVRAIPRGARTTLLGYAPHDLSAVPVPHPWEERTASFGEVMAATSTDGWIVTKDGVVIGEEYTDAMTPHSMHLLMSVSKSLTTATVGALQGSGELDVRGDVSYYVPVLAHSG